MHHTPRLGYFIWFYPSTTVLTMALYVEAMAMFDDAQDAEMDIADGTAGMMTHEQQQQAADGHDQQLQYNGKPRTLWFESLRLRR